VVSPARLCHFLRAVARLQHERHPVLERVALAAFAHEGFVHQTFGHDDMGQSGEDRHIGTGPQRQVIGRLHMGRAHQIDAARIDDDQLGALA
jgi:hypothetical protein